MFSGYAYQKIMTDQNGQPVDYEYLEINDIYAKLIGLHRDKIIGKRVSEVLPGLLEESFDWVSFFGKVALEGGSDSTIQFFKPFNRWYQVNAYSPSKGYFVEVFNDVTEIKMKELELQQKNEELGGLYEEVSASEEELRQQNEQLTQLYEEITASEEELRQQNDHVSGLYEELAASEEELSMQNQLLSKSNDIIREKEQIYRLISEASDDGIWYWELQKGKREVSVNWYSDIGISLDEFSDMNKWYELLHPDDVEEARAEFDQYLAGKSERYESTYRIRTVDGDYKWIVSRGKALFNDQGEPYIMAGAHIDITYRKIREEKIYTLAYYDSLTGLPNRAHLLEKINECLCAEHKRVAIIFMDVDNFKQINDSLGFTIGDTMLKIIGHRLENTVKGTDFIARLSGDEFAAILYDVQDDEEVLDRTRCIKSCFDEPVMIDNNSHQLGVSIGIAVYPDDGVDPKELIKNADTAMFKVKNMGKNSISFFTQEMKEEFLRRINIEKQLKRALKHQEFKLLYQPQFEMKTGKIRGFEALLRWFNPSLGFVSPVVFIPIAEETGIINDIGEWVLREACSQYKQWQEQYHFNGIISVNISPTQLKKQDFYHLVLKILEETGIPPGCLELEITENLFIDALDSTKELLNELIAIGVKISLDDFGTGYSSLSYLKSLPIDTLKIDKSFIQNTSVKGVEQEITSSVIELVRKIGLETIAEGVEDPQQIDFLYHALCDNVQGFLTGRPKPADEVAYIIKKGKVDFEQYMHRDDF
ncbi:EAL domain-containing protein [Vallitalea pronyensis]|uniref:EAL domain-containing protein n=1 Tax=Vallitalea pronyensis TaxID=1348613 RepID=A0A8J8SHM3_9FIRM|nr:EAL domain-containing protein [Vallitalea pronyensis]QUI23726.1 EAL domain-containing protein [Vallitalea pronyensis]